VSFNEKLLSDFSMTLANDSNGVSCFNMTGKLRSNLTVPTASFLLKVKRREFNKDDVEEYPFEALKGTINICKMTKGVLGSFLAPYALENLKKHSSTLAAPSDKILPYIPTFIKKLAWELSITVKGKLAKKPVQLGLWKVYGSWIPNN
jgi:hypothetical protein